MLLWSGVTTTRGTAVEVCRMRKAENHCLRVTPDRCVSTYTFCIAGQRREEIPWNSYPPLVLRPIETDGLLPQSRKADSPLCLSTFPSLPPSTHTRMCLVRSRSPRMLRSLGRKMDAGQAHSPSDTCLSFFGCYGVSHSSLVCTTHPLVFPHHCHRC